MAAKVGSSAVSYGIGVQNRYSAFLEDEDGIVLSSVVINSMKRPNDAQLNNSNKQKSSLNGSQKSASSKLNGRTESSAGARKNDAQQKSLNLVNGQKQAKGDLRGNQQRTSKTQQQLSGAKAIQAPKQGSITGRPANFVQDGQMTTNYNKFSRNQANGNLNHQPNASQQQSKENDASAGLRSNRGNNQRFNRPRQFQSEDGKSGQPDGQVNANGQVTNEEEKRRRQKKRALDLKHKDPEKRESRRNHAANGSGEQAGPDNQTDNSLEVGHRGQRNRRDRVKGSDESALGPKSPRAKGPRNQESESNGERRDGQLGARRGDRPPRNRNGFGAGSRGSHGSRSENKNQEKPKPIPNFSDKSDFPSLAS